MDVTQDENDILSRNDVEHFTQEAYDLLCRLQRRLPSDLDPDAAFSLGQAIAQLQGVKPHVRKERLADGTFARRGET
jgi:hypothetical protein